MTVVRIWRALVEQGRGDDYQRFAIDRSLPMFRSHDGFVGVLFARQRDERAVITFWRDTDAVRRLEASPRYRETVAEISASGFLSGELSVEAYAIEGGVLDQPLF